MIVTCYRCPKQISFRGRRNRLFATAVAFGWLLISGRYFCADCGKDAE